MAKNLRLEDKAFGFVRVAPRPVKPRLSGLTICADRGLGMNRVADLLETSADYIDFVKLGKGSYRLQTETFLKKKIAAYKKADMRIFIAGDTSEMAFMQGVSGQFYKKVKQLGADGVEVSSAQISMSLRDKCELIKMASAEKLKVVAEVGQKGNESWTTAGKHIISQIKAYQKAGAWKVLIQGEGVSEDVELIKGGFIINLVAEFGTDGFIFQAKNSAAQEWFMANLGNAVNLDVYDDQVIDLELMRRGIRKRGVFGLIGSLGHDYADHE